VAEEEATRAERRREAMDECMATWVIDCYHVGPDLVGLS
jgi:hypothetical protein